MSRDSLLKIIKDLHGQADSVCRMEYMGSDLVDCPNCEEECYIDFEYSLSRIPELWELRDALLRLQIHIEVGYETCNKCKSWALLRGGLCEDCHRKESNNEISSNCNSSSSNSS